MNTLKLKSGLAALTVLCGSLLGLKDATSLAKTPQLKATGNTTIIYAHGIYTPLDPKGFTETARKLHKALVKELGDAWDIYYREPDHNTPPIGRFPSTHEPWGMQTFNWNCYAASFPHNLPAVPGQIQPTPLDVARDYVASAISATNSHHQSFGIGFDPTHRFWLNAAYWVPFGLLYGETLEPMVSPGGTLATQYARGHAFNFLADAAWLRNPETGLQIRDALGEKLDEQLKRLPPNENIIFAAHSGGSLLLSSLLMREAERTGDCPDADPNTLCGMFRDKRIKGVVNFGSQLSIFYPEWFIADNQGQSRFDRLAQYFEKNGEESRFWLQLAHRNDPLGFLIPDATHAPLRHGIGSWVIGNSDLPLLNQAKVNAPDSKKLAINAETTVRSPMQRLPIVKYLDLSGATTFSAHGWYWNKPAAFAQFVKSAYQDSIDPALPKLSHS